MPVQLAGVDVLAPGRPVLIVDDGTQLTAALCDGLLAAATDSQPDAPRVVVVLTPDAQRAGLASSVVAVPLAGYSEADLSAALAEITRRHGAPGGVIAQVWRGSQEVRAASMHDQLRFLLLVPHKV